VQLELFPEPPPAQVKPMIDPHFGCSIKGCNRRAVVSVTTEHGGGITSEYWLCERHQDYQR
jgi:hypothetical protein